ncbi:MAG: cation:proton antiporter [Alphaproteobacteria bacterium]|nr:cation:proton antiporter [Alphaproteobacteria bacterium]
MHSIHALIIDLTLITIYATIFTLIFKKLKQPTVLAYLLAGILVGPHFNFLPTITDKEDISLWADIGVIFLLFSLGLEFSFSKMINVGKSAMITAMANILFMLFLGYNVGLLLDWPVIDSFFLGSMISMSSTTIIIKAFDDLNVKKQKFTDLVFGVLVVEDIVGILLLVLLPTIALGNNINSEELIVSTLKLVFFLVLCFISGIYLVPTLLKKVTPLLNDELLLLTIIGLCFSMVLLATYTGFSSALGAFIMGSILADTDIINRIESVLKPIKDFFGAVFFVSVGMMVNPAMFITYAGPIFVITLIVIIGKVSFSCFGFLYSGQNLKTSIQGGFSLAQVGEFAFIIASLGLSLGVLSEKIYPIIVAVSVITTFLTPMMIKASDPFYKRIVKIIPSNLNKYIERNTSLADETKMEEKRWKLLFRNYTIRMVLFSMILSAILGASNYFLKPFIHEYLPNIPARIVVTSITLIVMAPFLKALIGWESVLPVYFKEKLAAIACKLSRKKPTDENHPSAIKKLEEKFDFCHMTGEIEHARNFFVSNQKIAALYFKLWTAKKLNRFPLILLTSFRLLVVMFFIVIAIHQFLTENNNVTIFMVAISVFVLFQSRWLFNQYMKIEKQFLTNLAGRNKEENKEQTTSTDGKETEATASSD